MTLKTFNIPFFCCYTLSKQIVGLLGLLMFYGFPNFAQSSVLGSEVWYKIGVTKAGIYRIDANFFKKNGLDASKINPQNIRIFGNGGKMLPQLNSQPRPTDLLENAIWVEGESDGLFDATDYIYFYGESPTEISYNADNQSFTHQINYYSDTTFYFLNFSSTKGLRVKNQEVLPIQANRITTFDDYIFQEDELRSLVNSGREWVGEYFLHNSEKSFELQTEGILSDSPIILSTSFVSAAYKPSNFIIKLNNQEVGNQPMGIIGTSKYALKGIETPKVFSILPSDSPTQKLSFNYINKDSTGGAYLNYFKIQFKRKIQFYNQQTFIRSIASLSTNLSTFGVQNANNSLKIWNVTNPQHPENILLSFQNSVATFTAKTKDTLRTFISFSDKNPYEPASFYKIANQQLKSFETPHLLIITAKKWKKSADRLADFRRKNNNFQVIVATTDEVYNEFSSGKPDPTAVRDLARFYWLKNPQKFKYLLLLADATYDYKNHNQQPDLDLDSYIPTYESRESFDPVLSFSSDDYFGFFEDKDGNWFENSQGDHTLDIGIGRLPAKTALEAETMVEKIIEYETNKNSLGNWRRKVSFVADNGDSNIHQRDADEISKIASSSNNALTINKLYLDAFPLVSIPNGTASPQANKALNQTIAEGSLIINYNGHGGERGWTDEQILTTTDILNWKNRNRLALFLTATCDFGKFDNPATVSGAELAMISPKGAAIALLTTTRPVYSNTNFKLDSAFFRAFQQPKQPLGDIFRQTKNNSLAGVINRNFSLLGDPSMSLSYPKLEAALTKINNQKPENQLIKALSKVTLEGEIRNESTIASNFSGKIQISVFDKMSTVSTLGQREAKFKYQTFKNQLFEGIAQIKNGKFTASFVVPKDINYQEGFGRIELYAVNADSTIDAIGSFDKMLIGGSESIVQPDNTPPKISISVDKNNRLEAIISDESGINISRAGIGHDLILTLNDTLQIAVNQYFINTEGFEKGILRYDFGNLPAGKYTVKLKIWDTYNNSTEEAFEFLVEDTPFEIHEISNFPNPFANQTTFKFRHNKPNNDLTFEISIYDLSGKELLSQQSSCYVCNETIEIGMNIDLPNGMYIYQISALLLTTQQKATKGNRAVIWK